MSPKLCLSIAATSQRRRLWLTFRNVDEAAGDVSVLFKCGDDLRQDILTLQMLSIMDRVLRLFSYSVSMQETQYHLLNK
jgi:phosphatidylinositol kinase/protein kinase (PI-3  family)